MRWCRTVGKLNGHWELSNLLIKLLYVFRCCSAVVKRVPTFLNLSFLLATLLSFTPDDNKKMAQHFISRQQTCSGYLSPLWPAAPSGGPQSSAGSLLSPALMNPAGKMSNTMNQLHPSLWSRFIISVTEPVVLFRPLLCEELPVSQKHWAPAS